MKPYYGKRTFSFPTDAPAPTRFGDDPFKLHFKKLSNGTKITASNSRNFQRPKSHSSSSTRSRTTSTVSRLQSPRTRKISNQNTKIHFVSNLPPVLGKMLNSWDTGNRQVRKQILEHFLQKYSRQTSATIEADFGNGGSLLLSRFSSFLKMSYRSGFELALQLQVLNTFIIAASGSTYLSELLENGVIVTALELLSVGREIVGNEDIIASLQLLRRVAATGRLYKEILCEHEAVNKIVDCLYSESNRDVCEVSRALIVELGTGNPRYAHLVLRGLMKILPCQNSHAKRIGAQVTRMLLSSYSPHQYIGTNSSDGQRAREDTMLAFVPLTINMLKSIDLQVQYEAIELLKTLVREGKLGASITMGLLPLLENIEIVSAAKSVTTGAVNTTEDEKPDKANSDVCAPEDGQNAYDRKCHACYGWQEAGIKALCELCKTFDNVVDSLVRCHAMPYILTVFLNNRNNHAQQIAREVLLIMVEHFPTVLDTIKESYSIGNGLLWDIIKRFNETNQEERNRALLEIATRGSYQDDKQIPQQNEKFIMNKIKCRKLLDDSEEFSGSDAEFLFIENEIAKEEKANANAAALAQRHSRSKGDLNSKGEAGSVESDEEEQHKDDGSDYREIMNRVIERSNAQ